LLWSAYARVVVTSQRGRLYTSASVSVRVGLVGLGYWGPNLARNLNTLESCELVWCCDADDSSRDRWQRLHPEARFTAEFDELLADPELDAIALATPVPTHAPLAERILAAGKHCFVEKPLAQDAASAERVARLADERGLVLMVGHLLSYHPGVRQLADLIAQGELGDIYYLYSQRVNLGKLRADENALWSLGAHDVSVLLELAQGNPTEASARGEAYVRPGVEDVIFAYIRFDTGLAAHLHLSWLDPHKLRKITVVGSARMATLDDMAFDRKLTIWDKGFDASADTYGEYVARSGAIWSPAVPSDEPLRLECEHFVDCVRTGARPHTDGAAGVRVVSVLEAMQASLDAGGAPRTVGEPVGSSA
jgi:predicted dehydrogenase